MQFIINSARLLLIRLISSAFLLLRGDTDVIISRLNAFRWEICISAFLGLWRGVVFVAIFLVNKGRHFDGRLVILYVNLAVVD